MKNLLLKLLASSLVVACIAPSASALEPHLKFRSFANTNSRALWNIHKVLVGKKGKGPEVPGPTGLVKLLKASDKAFKYMGPACTKEFAGLKDSTGDREPYKKKGVACRYATKYKEIIAGVADTSLKQLVADDVKKVDRILGKLAKGKEVYQSDLDLLADPESLVKKRSKAIAKLYQALGKPAPGDLFGPVREAAKKGAAGLAAAGKAKNFPAEAKHKNKSAAKAFKSFLKGEGFKMVKAKMTFPDWKIFRRGGIPNYKSRAGVALVKMKGEAHCRVYRMVANADYKGGGKYQKPQAKYGYSKDKYIVSSCKK